MAQVSSSSSSSGVSSSSGPRSTFMGEHSRQPEPIVLDQDYRETEEVKDTANPREDLWMSTMDGRYNSAPIPVRVGQGQLAETFYVHADILNKSEWFRKALSSDFKEGKAQVVELPEEDPIIFHYLIAFLYEDNFAPVKAAALALEPVPDKGKARERGSPSSAGPMTAERSTSRIPLDQSFEETAAQNQTVKSLGRHRSDCTCNRCLNSADRITRCWQCGSFGVGMGRHSPGAPPPPGGRDHGMPAARRGAWARRRGPVTPAGPAPADEHDLAPRGAGNDIDDAMPEEDMRTWLMAYQLSLEVYICANRYLMEPLKKAVTRSCIDLLEIAGPDAAIPEVLHSCSKLYSGLPEGDALLRMVLARVGFLQPLLWQKSPVSTSEFLITNPEVAAAMLRETVMRHEADNFKGLPAMEEPPSRQDSRHMPSSYIPTYMEPLPPAPPGPAMPGARQPRF